MISEPKTSRVTEPPASAFVAPARVNLIGEHTDYTGGLVMPMAIPFATVAHLRPAVDGRYTFTSDLFPNSRSMTPEDRSSRINDWSDYPVGVLRQIQAMNIAVPPFDIHFSGDVPLGAGLSSSASVEVATAVALLSHARTSILPAQIAMLCQRAENDYVGSPCGIMDQFVITAAKADHALLLNTRELSFELLPMNHGALAECRIVVANSGVRHSIASGDYGVRRREVEAGQAKLRERFAGIRDLRDATLDQLMACEHEMTPESFRRCRHIITENHRVLDARAAMFEGNPVRMGSIMTAAHASERDDFECSIAEIDFLVEIATQVPGCYGARLTGGGFGGCTVNLVESENIDHFVSSLQSAYHSRFGLNLQTYVCNAVDGAVAHADAKRNATEKER